MQRGNESEVAAILAQITAEYEAGHNALYATALGTPRHAFITARMENMKHLSDALEVLVGSGAMHLIATTLDQASC